MFGSGKGGYSMPAMPGYMVGAMGQWQSQMSRLTGMGTDPFRGCPTPPRPRLRAVMRCVYCGRQRHDDLKKTCPGCGATEVKCEIQP